MYDFYKIIALAENMSGEKLSEELPINAEFDTAMSDDFNTALALSNLFSYFKAIKSKVNKNDLTAKLDVENLRKTYSLLGLFTKNANDFIKEVDGKYSSAVPSEVIALADERFFSKKE